MTTKTWPGSGAKYDEVETITVTNGATGIPATPYEMPWVKRKDEPLQTFQSVFKGIFAEAFDLLVERQRKYGPGNIESQGIFGVFTRLRNDKIERLKRALNGRIEHGDIVLDTDLADFGDESFEDALLDCANYSLIILALKRGVWGKPLEEDLGKG